MLNKEKFAKEIVEAALYGRVALKGGIPVCCDSIACSECGLGHTEDCDKARFAWASSEYIEKPVDPGWAVDTKVLFSDDGKEWHRGHYAGFDRISQFCFLTWSDGRTSWSSDEYGQRLGWRYAKLAEEES